MSTTIAADARWAAVLAGFSRGWIETRQTFTQTAAVITHWFAPAIYVLILVLFRKMIAPGMGVSASAMMLPGFLCMAIIMGGLSGPSGGITADREDGTLLRAKATPNGMLGYLTGKIVMCALTTLLTLVVILVAGVATVNGLSFDARTWLLLALIFIVGMVSTVPIGVALGAVLRSTLQAMLVPLLSMLIIIISGIFFPIAKLPIGLQWLVQAFPAYWVGLGARSAMLPAEMVAAETSKWHTIEMFAVPGAWAVAGLLLAPILLRRMARNQSGSAVAKVRERIRARGY
jgi:ABC-2 type transport system permease protein